MTTDSLSTGRLYQLRKKTFCSLLQCVIHHTALRRQLNERVLPYQSDYVTIVNAMKLYFAEPCKFAEIILCRTLQRPSLKISAIRRPFFNSSTKQKYEYEYVLSL